MVDKDGKNFLSEYSSHTLDKKARTHISEDGGFHTTFYKGEMLLDSKEYTSEVLAEHAADTFIHD